MRKTGNHEWESFGRDNPYYAVLTEDEYDSERLDAEAKERFFRSGFEHVEGLRKEIQTRLWDGLFSPTRTMDFGCGVGRITLPLAAMSEEVVGADVSPAMLEEARKHASERGVGNVFFALSDEELSRIEGTFDFIHSYIVFQHIYPKEGMRILKILLERLEPGGLAALHFTYHRRAPRSRYVAQWMRKHLPLAHGVGNLLQGKDFFTPLMQWNNYDLNKVFLVLQEKGCHSITVRYTDHGGGHLGVYIFFQKGAPPRM